MTTSLSGIVHRSAGGFAQDRPIALVQVEPIRTTATRAANAVGVHAFPRRRRDRLAIVTDQNTAEVLDFSAYQQAAARTAALIATDHPVVYPTLGLVNEAGEVAGKVKKIFRDRQGQITDTDREALALELGDVLWYLSEICTRLGIRLEDVAARNIAKIADRASRGVLSGEGDLR